MLLMQELDKKGMPYEMLWPILSMPEMSLGLFGQKQAPLSALQGRKHLC